MDEKKRAFNRLVIITTIAVYFLILVGGIVRNTGSGMGCPDWPKCFGAYIPPVSEQQLPEDYQQIYLQKRLSKTDRLANLLTSLGFTETAKKILSDPNLYQEDEFNPRTAWIEYINRMIGVIIGFLIVLTTYRSFVFRKSVPLITYTSITGLVLVLFQGWFGSLVVATNLIPAFVSIHMVLALLQVLLLIYLNILSSNKVDATGFIPVYLRTSSLLFLLLFIPQILLGTQVRHLVDQSIFDGLEKINWLNSIDWRFYFHRTYSLVFLITTGWISIKLYRDAKVNSRLKGLMLLVFILIAFESASGAIMYYFHFPVGIQPLHLLVASIIFGLLFYLTLVSRLKSSK